MGFVSHGSGLPSTPSSPTPELRGLILEGHLSRQPGPYSSCFLSYPQGPEAKGSAPRRAQNSLPKNSAEVWEFECHTTWEGLVDVGRMTAVTLLPKPPASHLAGRLGGEKQCQGLAPRPSLHISSTHFYSFPIGQMYLTGFHKHCFLVGSLFFSSTSYRKSRVFVFVFHCANDYTDF